ncbi:MAG: response regulator [Acidimicrobiales bacterium]|jgi:putative two-component system response regulator
MARLLIVDDDAQLREWLRPVLEARGYSVEEATSLPGARDRLGAETFELVLCAISMSGESGLALVREVAAELPDTAVLLMTRVQDPDVTDEALDLGVCGYLAKPFLPNEVLISVASGLRRRELEKARRAHVEELEGKLLARGSALRTALTRLAEVETRTQLAEQETVERLVSALTLRGEETGAHIARMSRYAAALAARWGVDTWTSDEFRVATMLHDVGKIGVPDAILLKPGPLTEEEFAIIRRHPALGASLIGEGTSRVLLLGARIALTHHERWDGAGYPAGLAGEAIPLEGRIAAVADVFDALTSHRVYRRDIAADQAIEMMLAERGRQLDPDLLDLFESSMIEMLAIRDEYADAPLGAAVRVLVVGSRRLFTDALARFLDTSEGIFVVGTAASGHEAESLLKDRDADVVVIDAELPDTSGLDFARRMPALKMGAAVILLAARDDNALVLSALDAGCAGVVVRDRAFDDLGAAIAAAHSGEPVVTSGRLLGLLRNRSAKLDVGLTRRENEVLVLMAEGLSNQVIAERLTVSLNTVRNHVQRILTKLPAHSKLEAVAEAGRRGLLPPRT